MKNWMKAVEAHHAHVKALADEHEEYTVLWTSLIGSQNYGLESENSDVDTFTVILPRYIDFISDRPMISFEREVSDGKVVVKDFRLIMNNLRKTTPNSIEVFLSRFKVFEPEYKEIEKVFFNPDTLYHLTHANYQSMVNAIAGMIYQLHGRNMTIGKRYAHALRLENTYNQFFNSDKVDYLLQFKFSGIKDLARCAKFSDGSDDEYYIVEYEKICDALSDKAKLFEYIQEHRAEEFTARYMIGRLQFEVMKVYLKQNGFEYKE